MASFAQWLESWDDELDQIEKAFGCPRAQAVQIMLLMKLTDDLKELEDWEADND